MRCLLIVALAMLVPQPALAQSRWFDPTEYERAALPPGAGVNYYVDGTRGSDTNNGLTAATAFKTIRKATDRHLLPGTRVLIRAGVYKERPALALDDSGAEGNPTMIGPYGDGPVKIDGSWRIPAWVLVRGSVYMATGIASVQGVVVDEVPLFPAVPIPSSSTNGHMGTYTEGAIARAGDYFFDAAAQRVYVWCPDGKSPAEHDVGVIEFGPAAGTTVSGSGTHDITFYGLTFRFAAGHGISMIGNNLKVENCRAIFNGKGGINLYTYQSGLSTGAQMIKNEVAWNAMNNWPRGRLKWCCWAKGMVLNGTPGVLIQGNVARKNGGEGLDVTSNSIMRDNIAHDNWSVNLYAVGGGNSLLERNLSYSNPIDLGELRNNGDPVPTDGQNMKRLRPIGILFADERLPARVVDVTIRNNIIINCRRGIDTYMGQSVLDANEGGIVGDRIYNNTIVVPKVTDGEKILGNVISGMSIPYYRGRNRNSEIRNNLVVASDSYSWLIHRADNPGAGDGFVGLTLTNNLLYHATKAAPYFWGSALTHAQWVALAGTAHGAGDVTADPLLVNSGTLLPLDKRVQAGSPAIGAGRPNGLVDDWQTAARGSPPDIGALEARAAERYGGSDDRSRPEVVGPSTQQRAFTNADLQASSEPTRQTPGVSSAGNGSAPPAGVGQEATGGGTPRGATSGSPGQPVTTTTGAGQGSTGSIASSGSSVVPTQARSTGASPTDQSGGYSAGAASGSGSSKRVFTNDDLVAGGHSSGRDNGNRGTVSFPGDSTLVPDDMVPAVRPSLAPDRTPSPAATPTPGPAPPVGARYFPPLAPWYREVSTAPLDPESPSVIRYLKRVGWGTGTMHIDFGIEVLNASEATPSLPFTARAPLWLPDCDQVPVPIPPGGRLESESGYTCTTDGECRLIVVDRGRMRLFEMWRADIRDGVFTGGCLAVWDMARRYPASGRGEQCRSADEAGYPIAPLLFTADEVAAGQINHAIRFVLPRDRINGGVYVHPATHAGRAGGPVDAPPYGTRLRLKASYTVATLSAGAQVVARAMQRYGMLLADGGNVTLTAQSDHSTTAKWSGLLGPLDLSSLKPDDFEMVVAGPRIPATGSCKRNP